MPRHAAWFFAAGECHYYRRRRAFAMPLASLFFRWLHYADMPFSPLFMLSRRILPSFGLIAISRHYFRFTLYAIRHFRPLIRFRYYAIRFI